MLRDYLYDRIRAFQFNSGDSTYTFEDRLADETSWPPAFARHAIDEYRKFLLLAATAGHPVSPSEAVDEVWHLHLLYTRSYWDELCARVLPRPLHHEPSTGGAAERAKFDDWYARTLDSYRATFEAEPPAAVWPPPGRDRTAARPREHVNPDTHWVLPKSRVIGALCVGAVVVLLLAIASGCGSASGRGSLNPFDLRGPQFLAFFFVAFAFATALAWMIRSAARGRDEEVYGASTKPPNLNSYETAYLSGGADHAVNAAVTNLIDRNLLLANPKDGTLRAVTPAPTGLHALEAAVHRAVSPTLGTRMSRVRASARQEAERIADRLIERDLLVGRSAAGGARALATLVALSVPAVGAIKVFVGLSREKPVGFLVVACAVTAVVALLLFARRPFRTRRGDAALRRMKETYAWLESTPPDVAGPDLTMAVAIFGLGALAHTPLAPLRKTLREHGQDAGAYGGSGCGGGGWTDGGSSGGGSSCGNGGGCGGCGGGGCGGS